jgi:hypothetical protein
MATVKKTKKAQAGYSVGTYATRDKATGNYDQLDRYKTPQGDRYYRTSGPDLSSLQKINSRKALMNNPDSVRSNTLTAREKEVMKSQEPMKKGGKMSKVKAKAKDGKWIQKAVNPKHKGYCTPMTKATCTPKRKALAKTFKAMGRARKGK